MSRRRSRTSREEHRAYLESEAWKARRARFMALPENHSCRACKSRIELDVHHVSYARVMNEADADLCTLCRTCHEFVHAIEEQWGIDLVRATQMVVRTMRAADDTGKIPTPDPKWKPGKLARQVREAPRRAVPGPFDVWSKKAARHRTGRPKGSGRLHDAPRRVYLQKGVLGH